MSLLIRRKKNKKARKKEAGEQTRKRQTTDFRGDEPFLLRLELEARRLTQSQNGEQLNRESVDNIIKMPLLPSFVNWKDNLDEYFLRFERYADVPK